MRTEDYIVLVLLGIFAVAAALLERGSKRSALETLFSENVGKELRNALPRLFLKPSDLSQQIVQFFALMSWVLLLVYPFLRLYGVIPELVEGSSFRPFRSDLAVMGVLFIGALYLTTKLREPK